MSGYIRYCLRVSHDATAAVELECQILHTVMADPVMTCDGHTYERTAITRWLRPDNMSSPLLAAVRGYDVLNTVSFTCKEWKEDSFWNLIEYPSAKLTTHPQILLR